MPAVDRSASPVCRDDTGTALVMVLILAMLGLALALAMVTLADTEMISATAHRDGIETLHAAEAGLEAAIDELSSIATWSGVLSGGVNSRFRDGTTTPSTRLAGLIDVGVLTASLQAQSDAQSSWGANNPQWRMFASGPLELLAGDPGLTGPYVLVWVADDESEVDGDPWSDVNGILRLRSEARGRRESRRVIEAVIARTAVPGVTRLASWRESR